MTSRALVVATALLAVGTIAGCSRTVPGTVAMTTEPGASLSTSESAPSRAPRTSSPRSPSTAPGDPQSITCGEFLELAPADQAAVVNEIFGEYGPVIGGDEMDTMRLAADAMCQFLPKDIGLADILLGGSPP